MSFKVLLFKPAATNLPLLFLTLALQSMSSSGQAPPTEAMTSDKSEMMAPDDMMISGKEKMMAPEDIVETADGSQRVWLQSGNKNVRGLYRPETSGTVHGGALLIPNINRKPDTEGLVNSLQNVLPRTHWYTLALDLTSATLNEKEVQQVIASGVNYFHSQGVFNIVLIGKGIGGAYATQYMADLPPPPEGELQSIRALILIDANNHIPGSDINILEKVALVNVPLLDAYTATDLQQKERMQTRTRARYKKTPGDSDYQPIKLMPSVSLQSINERRSTKRIRGWLDKNVAGLMTDN